MKKFFCVWREFTFSKLIGVLENENKEDVKNENL